MNLYPDPTLVNSQPACPVVRGPGHLGQAGLPMIF